MFMNYVLTAVVCFLGLIFGALLAFIAPEELEKGRKHFVILKNVLLASIFIVMMYFWENYWVIAIFFALFLLSFFKLEYTSYMLLAFIFYVGYQMGFFLMESLLIFLYGFPIGTLFAYERIKKKKRTIIRELVLSHIWFLILAILLFILSF